MRTYVVDFMRENGSEDFRCVEANSARDAIEIFRRAGKSDNWLGVDFATVRIIRVSEL